MTAAPAVDSPDPRAGASPVDAVPRTADMLAAAWTAWAACPVLLVLVNRAGVVQAANPAFARACGRSCEDLAGSSAFGLLPMEIAVAAATDPGSPARRLLKVPEQVLVDAHGDRHRIAWAIDTVTLEGTGSSHLLATGVDVTSERAVQSELREQAEHDPLTGLANRATVRRALGICLDPLRGAGASLLYCDLDGFKAVNDQHGHHAGDLVLRAVADRLTATTRAEDIVARMGGDEFVVLVPAGGGVDAKAMATRIERAVRRPVRADGMTLRVGVSIGATVADVGQDPEQVLQQADAAMYRRKQARKKAAGRVSGPRT